MENAITSLTLKVRKSIAKELTKVSSWFKNVANAVYRSPQELRVMPWFRDHGDQTLRLDYSLEPDSVVFDVGGYQGQWASDIFSRYCCQIYVFEAHRQYATQIQRRFKQNAKVLVYPFGLGEHTERAIIASMGDSSSLFGEHENGVSAEIVRAADFFAKHQIERIDLMKINIEGAEYELLEHLLKSGLIRRICNLQVQFHDFVPNAVQRMRAIQQQLMKTHQLTYQYEFVWENWTCKKN